jgi:heterodisulfide reductase subunit A-like polyferredoxin
MRERDKESGETVSEITKLTIRAQDLSVSIGHWNNAYMVLVALTVLLAAGVFITQLVANKKSGILASTQDAIIKEKDRIAKVDSDAKEIKIAGALQTAGDSEKAAAEANERAGKANERAAEANTKAEGFRLDIAKANERAASANETAEKERVARLQLEARLGVCRS